MGRNVTSSACKHCGAMPADEHAGWCATQAKQTEPAGNIITAWIPMTDPHDVALISKLGEEAAELAKACSRAIAQGLDGTSEGQEGRTNGLEILCEYHDCLAVMQAMGERLTIPEMDTHGLKMTDRLWGKVKGFRKWMRLIDDHKATQPQPVEVQFVFNPDVDSPHMTFVECEVDGKSVRVGGDWENRPDGLAQFPVTVMLPPDPKS